MRASLLLMLLTVTAAPVASARQLETIYVQGRTLSGAEALTDYIAPDLGNGVVGDVVRALGTRAVVTLPNGDFAAVVNTNPATLGFGNSPSPTSGGGGAEYVFGATDRGVTPRALLRERTVNNASTGGVGIDLRDLGSAGIDYAGNVSFTAGIPDPRPNRSQFQISSLWENDTLVYAESDIVPAGPLAGNYFDSAGQLYRSPDGETRWTASLTDAPFGSNTVASVLFRDTTTFDVILRSGDVIPSLGTVELGGITNVRWSLGGTHYIAELDVDSGGASLEAMTVSGNAVLTQSGGVVRDGEIIPAADGGLPGEVWTGFQRSDVNEAGVAAFGGFTNAGSGLSNVIVVDGVIRYREGDVLDGVTLSGLPSGVGINDRGDVALVWSDHLFINDEVVAEVGDLVDTDADGSVDGVVSAGFLPGDRLEMTNLPAAGGDGLPVVYFTAEVLGEGDSYFRLTAADTSTGDYNGDGVVNAADYTVWRDANGSAVLLGADGDQDNVVGPGDYTVWAGGYGGSVPPATATPEPSAVALLSVLIGGLTRRRR